MAEPTVTPKQWQRDVLIGGGVILVALCGTFFLLGRQYYISKVADALMLEETDSIVRDEAWARTIYTFTHSYLAFAVIGTAAVVSALLWSRYVAHGLAAMFGVGYAASGVMILVRTQMPPLVGVFQLAIGALLLRLAYASWKQKDRAAWAFLLSLSAVLAGATLFGAPRIKAAMAAPGLWWVLIIPFLFTAQGIALYTSRRDYA
jgi:hypothetical protein